MAHVLESTFAKQLDAKFRAAASAFAALSPGTVPGALNVQLWPVLESKYSMALTAGSWVFSSLRASAHHVARVGAPPPYILAGKMPTSPNMSGLP
jgi:hypothetical protein